MVVVAHPDDESFWMGGTIRRHARDGDSVTVLALSDGVGSRFRWWQWLAHRRAAKERAHQFRAACCWLGAHSFAIKPVFRDQQSDTVPRLTLNRRIAALMGRPTVVYTHHVGDLNVDHRRVAEAVRVWARGKHVAVISMQPEWPDLCVGQAWGPERVEIDPMPMYCKIAACRQYKDEIRESPHPRSGVVVRGRPEEFMRIQ
jgi:LmbE family N-acetylglucosaminyl deacetylase